ncbi:MAG: metal-dependent hydrolase [Haloferacaceae archaeon]
MWPWGHAAVAYLAYRVGWLRGRRAPDGDEAVALGVAALAADLVDKPLAHGVDALASGRSLAHTVFVALALSALVAAYVHRGGGRGAVAFAVGHWTHLAADGLHSLLVGDWRGLAYLDWPLGAHPDPVPAASFLEYVTTVYLARTTGPVRLVPPDDRAWFLLQVPLALGTLALWWRDGAPGVDRVRSALPPAGR